MSSYLVTYELEYDSDWCQFDDEVIERTIAGDGGDYFVGDDVQEASE